MWDEGPVLAVGKGELVREKATVLPIRRRMQVVRCGALVPLPMLRALGRCSEKRTGVSECISGVSHSAF